MEEHLTVICPVTGYPTHFSCLVCPVTGQIDPAISNTMPYCDIILPYPTDLVILMAYCHAKCWYCRHPPPTPQLMTPNSYVHNVSITPYIDIIMLFFALLSHILTL